MKYITCYDFTAWYGGFMDKSRVTRQEEHARRYIDDGWMKRIIKEINNIEVVVFEKNKRSGILRDFRLYISRENGFGDEYFIDDRGYVEKNGEYVGMINPVSLLNVLKMIERWGKTTKKT